MIGLARSRRSRIAALLAASILAGVLAACAFRQPPAASAPYPAPGTVVRMADGRVRATGVVARYPVAGMGEVYSEWVLYSALGNETASPGVIAALVQKRAATLGGPGRVATDPLAPFDGKLVTVEGTMTAPFVSRGRSSSPWPRLTVASITTAPPEAQARVTWKGALVQPGRWFDEPWRYNLAQAYEMILTERSGVGGYRDLAAAEKAHGSRIPAPTSPLAGRLVGVLLVGPPKENWYLAYSSGLVVSGPQGSMNKGTAWIYSTLNDGSSSKQRLVDVNGRPGLIGEMNGLGPGVLTHYIFFWDGTQVAGIEYRGLGRGPSDDDLIAIAASISPR